MNTRTIVFDDSVRQALLVLLSRTRVFSLDKDLKRQYHLVCVMNDRISDAIAYLNQHNKCAPQTLEEYYAFMVFADNLYEGVKLAYEEMVASSTHQTWHELCDAIRPRYFAIAKGVSNELLRLSQGERLPDNMFFRYLRSVSFAHPFRTTDFKFINKRGKMPKNEKEGDIHYCPLVKVGDDVGFTPLGWDRNDTIEFVAYTDKRHKFVIFHVSYTAILGFLKSRYELLHLVVEHINGVLEAIYAKWRKRKIGRNHSPAQILTNLIMRLHGRCMRSDEIDEMVRFLSAEVNKRYPKNVRNVALFKRAIIDAIPRFCDCFDAQDDEGFYSAAKRILNPDLPSYTGSRTTRKYQMVINHRDRIITCLNERTFNRGDLHWGVVKLKQSFVSKWVTLNEKVMSVQEIWLLVCAAWYLENQDCVKRGVLRGKEFCSKMSYNHREKATNKGD